MWQRTRLMAPPLPCEDHEVLLASNIGIAGNSAAVELNNKSVLTHVAGMDISTLKTSRIADCVAAVTIVVCRMPDLRVINGDVAGGCLVYCVIWQSNSPIKVHRHYLDNKIHRDTLFLEVVYESSDLVKLSLPYTPGLLCFREGPFLVKAYEMLLLKKPELVPQVILIDGNGILHPRECGLACYVGVALDVPCIGVAKNLLHVDGIVRDDTHKRKVKAISSKGENFQLISNSGQVLGMALKTCEKAEKPVYVSVGHNISLATASWVVSMCTPKYRIPEPIRQADILSRELLRETFSENT